MDVTTKSTDDQLFSIEFNQLPDELENLITNSGQAKSATNLNQVEKGIAIYATGGDFYVDSGSANTYVLSAIGSKLAPPTLFAGFSFRFYPGNTNTGPSTANPVGLGVTSIKMPDGSDPPAGSIVQDREALLTYKAPNFILTHSSADIDILANIKRFSGLPVDILTLGSSFNIDNMVSGDTTKIKIIVATILASTANQAILQLTQSEGFNTFSVRSHCTFFENTAAHDSVSFENDYLARLGGGESDVDVNARALIIGNANLATKLSFVPIFSGVDTLILRVSSTHTVDLNATFLLEINAL